MLKEQSLEFVYRDYTKKPLSVGELREVFRKLKVQPKELLRSRDAKKHGVSAELSSEELLQKMAEFPRLLQRPIAILGEQAVVGRPVENLLVFGS